MILVSFCCNNPDNGNALGRVVGIEIHGADVDIELESRDDRGSAFVQLDTPPRGANSRCDGGVRIAGKSFGCYGYKTWFGNWCWDAARMAAVDVLGMVKFLRDRGWSCTSAEEEFYDAFKEGEDLTPELLSFALSDEPSEPLQQLGVLGGSEVDVETAAAPGAEVALEHGDVLGITAEDEGAQLVDAGEADIPGASSDGGLAVLLDEVNPVLVPVVVEVEQNAVEGSIHAK
jgi:hypothetical protein